jgi:hypothetical protein
MMSYSNLLGLYYQAAKVLLPCDRNKNGEQVLDLPCAPRKVIAQM